jgi:hypothetical protein
VRQLLINSSVVKTLTLKSSIPPIICRYQVEQLTKLADYAKLTESLVDHFHNDSRYAPHSNESFNLRFFFDSTHYKPGGPVIVLQSGETDAIGRLPFLQKGIVAIIAEATGGLGVILEHRYYGTSFPVPDLSTENMRFLTTQQALADQAYFQQNVVFPGLEDVDLTAPGTPWIAYGGSYAGAFVAFLRKLYPDVTWGAISSSGVTEAIWNFPEYYDPIIQYGPSDCVQTQQKLINVVDNILARNDSNMTESLQSGFGLEGLSHVADFATVISDINGYGMIGWQARNWDPAVNSPGFDHYCGNITATDIQWPGWEAKSPAVRALLDASDWANETRALLGPMLNFMAFINNSYVGNCAGTLDQCYSYLNESAEMYVDYSYDNQVWRSWTYQYCTQWGYLQPASSSGLPIVSRFQTLEHLATICRYGFNLTGEANVEEINQYGGFNLTYPRLANVGGEVDVWRPASNLATRDEPTVLNRTSTVSEPIILIANAGHHYE